MSRIRAAAPGSSSPRFPTGPKGRLIEAIAELINDKKLPILADVRDESTEDIRIVWSRAAARSIPDLMDSLFRLTDLETRVPLNLNVLDKDRTPRVMSLRRRWRRGSSISSRCCSAARTPAGKIADRMELLDGYLIAYLNLDRVIQIIRRRTSPSR
jgi:topoisomerase-4 subunit A